MANVNITEVYLLNAPLENDYKHTLYFSDMQAQQEYFSSLKQQKFSFTNLSNCHSGPVYKRSYTKSCNWLLDSFAMYEEILMSNSSS